MEFLIEMLYLCMIVLHRKIYGDPTVTHAATDRIVTLNYEVKENIYTFISTQYICTVMHTGIIKYKSTRHYYKVRFTTNSPTLSNHEEHCYPRLCPWFLRHTSYPHRLAINAHFKLVTSEL